MNITFDYKEIRNFFILYFTTIIVVYFSNRIIADILFAGYLFFFFYSKKDYFWIAFFFAIMYAPGYLFNTLDASHRSLEFRGGQIGYFQLIIFTSLVKILFKKSYSFIKPFNEYYIWVLFSIILFIIGISFGMSGRIFLRNAKDLSPFVFLFILPTLMRDSYNYYRLMNLLMSFSFFIFFTQLYVIVFGHHFMTFLGGTMMKEGEEIIRSYDSESVLIRPNYSTMVVIFNIFSSLFFISYGKNSKKHNQFLVIVLVVSIISILLTATRGYILGALLIVFFGATFKITRLLKVAGPILILLVILGSTTNTLTQLSWSLDRVSTVFTFLSGDVTAGGTLRRIDDRAPPVLKQWEYSPLVGKGLSDDTWEHSDQHVAWPTILLQGGIIGVIVLIYIFVSIGFEIIKIKNGHINYGRSLLGFYLAILFVHSTSFMVFSYIPGVGNINVFILFLSFVIILKKEKQTLQYARVNLMQ